MADAVEGTGPPVTWTARVELLVIGPLGEPVLHWLEAMPGCTGRVSHTRNGVTAVYGACVNGAELP